MSTDLRSILLGLRDEHGVLTPHGVVEAARPVDSPLHHRFTWDDTEAGPKWRLYEASHLIRQCRVTYKEAPDGPVSVRAFVAVPRDDAASCTYEPVEEALADDFTARLVMRAMEREWKQLERNYGHLDEFWQLIRRDSA